MTRLHPALALALLAACGGGKAKTTPADPAPIATTEQPPAPAEPAVTTPPAEPAPPAPPAPQNTTDVELSGKMLNLDEHTTWTPVASLPKGAQLTVIEGEPPFPAGKSFAFILKLPKNYKLPPHTHAVSERVTVLSGELSFGHGEKFDKKQMKDLKAGGIALIPAGHAHFVSTKTETILQLQGVGPWGIYYVDPKDDPRKPAVTKPTEPIEHPTDSDLEMAKLNTADIKWSPAPPSLPKGAEIAVLEGTPPFGPGKSFVFRVKFPDGYKIPVHHHPVTERIVVLSGTLKFGMGDKWDDAAMKVMKPGGVIYMPREHKHFVQAQGETVVQLQGVGPWGIVYANPDEDPRKKK